MTSTRPFGHSAIPTMVKMPRFRAAGPRKQFVVNAGRMAVSLLTLAFATGCSSSFFQITPEEGVTPAKKPAAEKPAPKPVVEKPAPSPAEKAPEKVSEKRGEEPKPVVVSKPPETPPQVAKPEPKKDEPRKEDPPRQTAPPKTAANTATVPLPVAPPIARRPEPVAEPPALEPTPAGSDSAGIARLMHAAALWDAVRLFHPGAVASPSAWDNATVRRLTDVRTATTREQYASVMREWLSRLNDPVTQLATGPKVSAASPAAAVQEVASATQVVATGTKKNRVVDTTVVLTWPVNAPTTDSVAWNGMIGALTRAEAATQLVIDLRTSRPSETVFENQGAVRDRQQQFASALSMMTVTGPSIRRRVYEGWPDERDSVPATSAVEWRVGKPLAVVRAQASRPRRVVIIANEFTALPPALMALVASKQASLVSDGLLRDDLLVPSRSISIGQGMSVVVRTGEMINADGSVGVQPDTLVPAPASPADSGAALRTAILVARGKLQVGSVTQRIMADNYNSPRDNAGQGAGAWNTAHYPIMGARLLALFKSWATLRNFHAYNELRDENIDDALYRIIPRVESATDAYSYASAMLDFASSAVDAQARLTSPTLEQHIGAAAAPFAVRWIEGRAIVTQIAANDAGRASGLVVGDEIVSADGYPMSAYVNEHRRYGAASNDWTRLRNTMDMVPRGIAGATNYRVRDAAGRERTASVERTADNYRKPLSSDRAASPAVRDLGAGLSYVDLALASMSDVEALLGNLTAARALIVDARGAVATPDGTMPATLRTVLQRTMQSPNAVIGKQALRVVAESCPPPESQLPGTGCVVDRRHYDDIAATDTSRRYRGRVVVLIDERTEGVMEQFAMAMEAAANATLVGSASAGSVGNVTATRLPGLMTLTFSSTEVRRPDGGQVQRVGLTPMVEARPTVKSVRAGTDDVLERAQQWLKEQLDPQPVRRRR